MSSPENKEPDGRPRISSTASYFDETTTAKAKEFVRCHSQSDLATSQGTKIDDTILEVDA